MTQSPYMMQGTQSTTGFVTPPCNATASAGFVAQPNATPVPHILNGVMSYPNGVYYQQPVVPQVPNQECCYAAEHGGYPQFPNNNRNNNGSNNNKSNNSNYKSKFNGSLICQICEKQGHSAVRCSPRNSNSNSQLQGDECQICKKPGHTAKTCKYRNANLTRQNGGTAMLACADHSRPGVWIVDSGATNYHMTADLNNLQTVTTYSPKDSVQFGQGDRENHI